MAQAIPTLPRALGRLVVLVALVAIAACARHQASQVATNPTKLMVAGTYDTQVSLIAGKNTCGSVTVEPNLTTVIQDAGATSLTLTHAGTTYRGSISPAASFSTEPTILDFSGTRYVISIGGQFSVAGFDATVHVVVQANNTAPCTYDVHWVGSKSGPSNTIP